MRTSVDRPLAWPYRAPCTDGGRPLGAPPTFSVVIAAYNAAPSLPAAVESVLAQTAPPLELIVCDDGSTDATAAALAPFGPRLTYLRKEHGGVASARNVALRIARGEFFAVLDADDEYLPDRLEALSELASARPDLDLLCTDALLELDGEVAGTFEEGCAFPLERQAAAILDRCFCVAPAARRSALLEIGGYDESLRTGSDWDSAIRLIHGGAKAGLVEAALYRYRIHSASLTAQRVATLRDRITLLRKAEALELGASERSALRRSLARQRGYLALTEAEAALRAGGGEARRRALAAAVSPGVGLRSRAAAVAASIAPQAAARRLERRALVGHSRLRRSVRNR
jgi:hypothetical protein